MRSPQGLSKGLASCSESLFRMSSLTCPAGFWGQRRKYLLLPGAHDPGGNAVLPVAAVALVLTLADTELVPATLTPLPPSLTLSQDKALRGAA